MDKVPIAAPSRQSLLAEFALVRDVPGHAGALVVRGPLGEQLFADRKLLGGSNQKAALAALWTAAFGKPLPPGYEATPAVIPVPGNSLLVVIAIIAILIGLLLPAVNTYSSRSSQSPHGTLVVPDDPAIWSSAILH